MRDSIKPTDVPYNAWSIDFEKFLDDSGPALSLFGRSMTFESALDAMEKFPADQALAGGVTKWPRRVSSPDVTLHGWKSLLTAYDEFFELVLSLLEQDLRHGLSPFMFQQTETMIGRIQGEWAASRKEGQEPLQSFWLPLKEHLEQRRLAVKYPHGFDEVKDAKSQPLSGTIEHFQREIAAMEACYHDQLNYQDYRIRELQFERDEMMDRLQQTRRHLDNVDQDDRGLLADQNAKIDRLVADREALSEENERIRAQWDDVIARLDLDYSRMVASKDTDKADVIMMRDKFVSKITDARRHMVNLISDKVFFATHFDEVLVELKNDLKAIGEYCYEIDLRPTSGTPSKDLSAKLRPSFAAKEDHPPFESFWNRKARDPQVAKERAPSKLPFAMEPKPNFDKIDNRSIYRAVTRPSRVSLSRVMSTSVLPSSSGLRNDHELNCPCSACSDAPPGWSFRESIFERPPSLKRKRQYSSKISPRTITNPVESLSHHIVDDEAEEAPNPFNESKWSPHPIYKAFKHAKSDYHQARNARYTRDCTRADKSDSDSQINISQSHQHHHHPTLPQNSKSAPNHFVALSFSNIPSRRYNHRPPPLRLLFSNFHPAIPTSATPPSASTPTPTAAVTAITAAHRPTVERLYDYEARGEGEWTDIVEGEEEEEEGEVEEGAMDCPECIDLCSSDPEVTGGTALGT